MSDRYYGYNVQAVWEAEGSLPRMHPKIRIFGSKGVPIGTLPVTENDFPTILQVATEAVKATPFRRGPAPPYSEDVAKNVVEALQAHGVLISVDIEEYAHNLKTAAEAVCEVKKVGQVSAEHFFPTDDDGSADYGRQSDGAVKATYRGDSCE